MTACHFLKDAYGTYIGTIHCIQEILATSRKIGLEFLFFKSAYRSALGKFIPKADN